jgi:hypothetical protein
MMTMGADIYLPSIFDPFLRAYEERREAQPSSNEGPIAAVERCYADFRASGGYFRNGYNSGDVMWAMGLSWWETVGPMLDADARLPIDRARELLAMIEARPLTREVIGRHYLENMTNGRQQHPTMGPIARIAEDAVGDAGKEADNQQPPDFEHVCQFLQQHREELLALLRKSIERNEPLQCSL